MRATQAAQRARSPPGAPHTSHTTSYHRPQHNEHQALQDEHAENARLRAERTCQMVVMRWVRRVNHRNLSRGLLQWRLFSAEGARAALGSAEAEANASNEAMRVLEASVEEAKVRAQKAEKSVAQVQQDAMARVREMGAQHETELDEQAAKHEEELDELAKEHEVRACLRRIASAA
jgi:2-succinyl-5-enolpyruvyl-6-hydroxy-3-cyclohexene-1-carboxylate synthase